MREGIVQPIGRVAVDRLIDGFYSEGEAAEPGASVGKDVEKCVGNCGSSKVR